MNKRNNGLNSTTIILLAIIAAGLIYLIIRNRKQLPAGTGGDGMVRYKNSETRKIEWDYEHMVPTSITITRESKQLP